MNWPRLPTPVHPRRPAEVLRRACRASAYRRRRDAGRAPVAVPKAQPRKPVTVYACDDCGARAVGDQRCDDCGTFMRRVGIGGTCPNCDEPVSLNELLDQDFTA